MGNVASRSTGGFGTTPSGPDRGWNGIAAEVTDEILWLEFLGMSVPS
jgi:hypothetical protein